MTTKPSTEGQLGLVYGTLSYIIWGFFPLYFKILEDVSPMHMLTQRIAWSVPTGLLLLMLAGRMRDLIAIFRNLKTLGWLALSGGLMGINWLIYIWAVQNERVLEGSLGYFINPLFSFVLAAIFFGERFSKLQMIAILLAGIGVLNQAIVVGQFPWVALSLCITFGIYGAIRKKIIVDSRAGFLLEVLLMFPFALAYLAYAWSQGAPLIAETRYESLLISLSGVLTAAPLILFALGAKRLRLSTIAILQYVGPTIQFMLGLYFGEAFTPAHAVTFGCIWLGVVLFSYGAIQNERKAKLVTAA